jgi:hypothetical protein
MSQGTAWHASSVRETCGAGVGMQLETSDIVVGAMMIIFGMLGLILGTRAADIEMEIFGFSLAVFSALFLFRLIKRYFDDVDAARQAVRAGGRHV